MSKHAGAVAELVEQLGEAAQAWGERVPSGWPFTCCGSPRPRHSHWPRRFAGYDRMSATVRPVSIWPKPIPVRFAVTPRATLRHGCVVEQPRDLMSLGSRRAFSAASTTSCWDALLRSRVSGPTS